MARISIPDQNREISDVKEMSEFLKPFGIWYEKWDVEGRIGRCDQRKPRNAGTGRDVG